MLVPRGLDASKYFRYKYKKYSDDDTY